LGAAPGPPVPEAEPQNAQEHEQHGEEPDRTEQHQRLVSGRGGGHDQAHQAARSRQSLRQQRHRCPGAAAPLGGDREPRPLAQDDQKQARQQDGEAAEAQEDAAPGRFPPGGVPERELRERPVRQKVPQERRQTRSLDGRNAHEKEDERHEEVDQIAQAGQVMRTGQPVLDALGQAEAVRAGRHEPTPVAAQDAQRPRRPAALLGEIRFEVHRSQAPGEDFGQEQAAPAWVQQQ